MTKSIFLILFIAIVLTGCSEKRVIKENSDIRKENLKGNVKSINLKRFEVEKKFGEIVKTDRVIYSINNHKEFHNDGSLKFEYFFGYEDVFYSICIYHYDSLNRLSDKVFRDGYGNLTGKIKYDYSDSTCKITEYNNEGKEIYIINQNVQDSMIVFESKWKYQKGEMQNIPEYIVEYEYDQNRRKIKESKIDILTLLRTNLKKYYSTTNYKYDKYDNLISAISKEYLKGYRIEIEYSDSTFQNIERSYNYDEFNNVIQETYIRTEPKSNTVTQTLSTLSSDNQYETEYHYEYDKQKNWISRVILKNGKPYGWEERFIVYED